MKLKNSKIKYIVWAFEIAFSCIILLLLFLTQILLLDKFYNVYKQRKIDDIAEILTSSKNIDKETLEQLAYENGICISFFYDNELSIISSVYNIGCSIEENNNQKQYVNSFIMSGKKEDSVIIRNNRFKNKTIIKAINLGDGTYVFLNSSIEALDSSIKLLKSQYIYIVVLVLVLSVLVGYFISSKISKPITKISNEAKKMANGDFNVTFKNNSKIYEIRELSETLDKAKKELSKTDELRRDLMANVGHDLKTPLTMIKAYAEMTRDFDNQSLDKKKENLNIIIDETDRLAILVNDILELSKMQAGNTDLKIEAFDLNDLILSIIKKESILVEKEGYIFEYDQKDNLIVKADKKRMEQVIYNLINNAINYTGKDMKVRIDITDLGKKYRVEITDTGKGIDKEDIKYIWDKYYHNSKKHKRNSVGTGLGLSIVKSILEQHNFNYGVNSKINKGTTFYFDITK